MFFVVVVVVVTFLADVTFVGGGDNIACAAIGIPIGIHVVAFC